MTTVIPATAKQNQLKSSFWAIFRRISIDKRLNTNDTAILIKYSNENPENPRTINARTGGTESKNDVWRASFCATPRDSKAVITMPLLDMPGITATPCAIPTMTASENLVSITGLSPVLCLRMTTPVTTRKIAIKKEPIYSGISTVSKK